MMLPGYFDLGVVALLIFVDGMGGQNPQWGYWKEGLTEAIYEGMRAYAHNAVTKYGAQLAERGVNVTRGGIAEW